MDGINENIVNISEWVKERRLRLGATIAATSLLLTGCTFLRVLAHLMRPLRR